MRNTILTAFALAIWACPPSPAPPDSGGDAAPPPAPDAGATACNIACAQMALAGCPEGLDPSCAKTCQHVVDTTLTTLPLDCLARARTKDDVHACGVKCP
jgi:hypothetical protein